MHFVFTLLSQLPDGLEKYETMLWWKLEAEQSKTSMLYKVAEFDAKLRIDYEGWSEALRGRHKCILTRLKRGSEIVHQFPSCFAECKNAVEQRELFLRSVREIEDVHDEARKTYSYLRHCATVFPPKQLTPSEIHLKHLYFEAEMLTKKALDLIYFLTRHPLGALSLFRCDNASGNDIRTELKKLAEELCRTDNTRIYGSNEAGAEMDDREKYSNLVQLNRDHIVGIWSRIKEMLTPMPLGLRNAYHGATQIPVQQPFSLSNNDNVM